jgi:hypothetical protein
MNILLILLSVAGSTVTYMGVRYAPEGYECLDGFHYGRPEGHLEESSFVQSIRSALDLQAIRLKVFPPL